MRYLYGSADDQLVAYAPGRRDFYRADDDVLWAHKSHDWLIAAASGKPIAHCTKGIYYSAETGEALYYEGPGPSPTESADAEPPADGLRLASPASEGPR
jgi:hypothetical protein